MPETEPAASETLAAARKASLNETPLHPGQPGRNASAQGVPGGSPSGGAHPGAEQRDEAKNHLFFLLQAQSMGIDIQVRGAEVFCSSASGNVDPDLLDYAARNAASLALLLRPDQDAAGGLPVVRPHPAEENEPFPLTENQEAYWLGRNSSLDSGGVGIHVFFEISIDALDRERFLNAWAATVERHAMLRAVILPGGTQKILESPGPVALEEERLAPGPEGGKILEAARREISHMQYNLLTWPQFRFKVFHLPEEPGAAPRSLLMGSLDVWSLDLRSLQVIFNDLADLYQGLDPGPLPEVGFRDYLLALQELHASPTYEKALEYWHGRIAGFPAAPALPVRPMAEMQTGFFTRRAHTLPEERWQPVKAMLQRKGFSISSALLAAYAAVIGRWSETKRFILNVPRYNRLPMHAEINDIVGEFASFSLLDADFSERLSFEEAARRIQRQLWNDLEFSHVSGVRVLREWKQTLSQAPSVMAPYVFTSEPEPVDGPAGSARAPSWRGAMERLGNVRNLLTQTPQVWIDSQFSEVDGNLHLSWDSLDGVFQEGVLPGMFAAYCALLESLASEEGWQSPELPLPGEDQALRGMLRGLDAEVPPGTLWDALLRHAGERPGAPAAIDALGAMTWKEAADETERLAALLRQRGLRPGHTAAFALPKGRRQMIAAMAIHACGAIVVPLDHESPAARLRTILNDSGAALLITDGGLVFPDREAPCPVLSLDAPGDWDGPPLPEPVSLPGGLFCMIYTSGSTGTPKGVMVPLDGIPNVIFDAARRFGLDHRDALIGLSPIYHDMGWFDMAASVFLGAALVLPAPERLKDPGHWLECLSRHRVTLWNSVPATMTMLLDYLEGNPGTRPDLSSLRRVFLGGDWIPLDTPARMERLLPSARLVSVGGPTEITIWNLLYPVETVDPQWRSIPYGYPINNAAYRILDERLEDCPAMVTGEMYCSGPFLSPGYLNDPARTEAAFFVHPRKNIRMFRTGDVGRLHTGGYIEFVGRRDNQVKRQGYRIELGEIEAAAGLHPAVSQAVAVLCRAPEGPDGNRGPDALALWAVPRPGAACTAGELREHVKALVPKYMMPSHIGMAEAFPLTQNNKIDRAALALLPLPGSLEDDAGERASTDKERLLEASWLGLLGRSAVGVDQNFFELGGNSITAVRLYNQVLAGNYPELSVASIFSFPTIRSLAAAMENAEAGGACGDGPGAPAATGDAQTGQTPAGQAAPGRLKAGKLRTAPPPWPLVSPLPHRPAQAPATRVQRRMFYEQAGQPEADIYNLCLQIDVEAGPESALDPARLEDAVNTVIARQEILRTTFREEAAAPGDGQSGPEVVQVISPELRVALELTDVSPLSGAAREETLAAWCREFTRRPYDLGAGPLLRAGLARTSPGRGRLFLAFHHIIMDGWSLTLFLNDLAAALEGAEGAGMPRPALQQADIAAWERSADFARAAEARLAPAAARFAGGGTPSAVVPARPTGEAPAGPEANGYVEEYIPDNVIRAVNETGTRCESTPFAVMCTAFALLMADYNRSDTAQIGTYIAARTLPGLEDLSGYLTCPAPLLFRFDRQKSVASAVRDAMGVLSEAIDTALLPFEDLIREAAPQRAANEHPLFGIAFTLDNTPAVSLRAGGLTLSPLGVRQYETSVDLEAAVSTDSRGTRINIAFNRAKYRAGEVEHIVRRFIALLERAVADPEAPLAGLSPVTAADAAALNGMRGDGARQEAPEPHARSVLDLFLARGEAAPDAPALTDVAMVGGRPQAVASLTYAELRRAAGVLAARMRKAGLAPGGRVVLHMPRGSGLAAAMLAAWQCGASFVPLPLSQSPERAARIIRASQAALICCPEDRAEEDAAFGIPLLHPDALPAGAFTAQEDQRPEPSARLAPGDEACLMFTSGSQGTPKGVRLTHGNWLARLEAGQKLLPFLPGEVGMAKTSTAFIDIFCEFFQPLVNGVPVYVLAEGEETDLETLLCHMRHWGVSRAMLVVSLIQSLLELLAPDQSGKANPHGLEKLRCVFSSGEPLPAGTARRFQELLPGCALFNTYGSTEVTADVISGPVGPVLQSGPGVTVPLGRVLRHSRVEVVDHLRRPLPPGMTGEIAVAGRCVCGGYLDGDESRFFSLDGTRYFATGDYGQWSDGGELLCLGRMDRQIKIRGQRIEPGEIEEALRGNAQVAEAAVVVVGEGPAAYLAACLVLREPGAVGMDALRRETRLRLSGAMMPGRFLEFPSLPRTASGKIDQTALLQEAVRRMSGGEVIEEGGGEAPRGRTETVLAGVWQELLGRPPQTRAEDFFAAGGHSLLAIRLVSLLRERCNAPLRVKDVFDTSAFADLAELVELLAGATGPASRDTGRDAGPSRYTEVI